MIFRITQKLGTKIGVNPSESIPASANPYVDWSAHLFTARRMQYVILTNTISLYSIVRYGRGITDCNQFVQRSLSCMREFMADDGNEFIFERLIAPDTEEVVFSKALTRSVIGSMNDLVIQAKIHLADGDVSPFDVSFKLNDTPMSYLKYANPRESFRAMKIQHRPSNHGLEPTR